MASLSSRAAGCVSGGRFIWRNPVYETLDATHARTHDARLCMRGFYFVGTARMDRKRPGLNAPGIGLRAFCSRGGSKLPPPPPPLPSSLSLSSASSWYLPRRCHTRKTSPPTLRRFPRREKSEIIPRDPGIYGPRQLGESSGLSNTDPSYTSRNPEYPVGLVCRRTIQVYVPALCALIFFLCLFWEE